MSNNGTTKFPDWVAYRLTPEESWGSLDLERKWRADPWLDESDTPEPSPDDYKDASKEPLKFDRGHLAPLAAYKGSESASEVNYYSNITPQAKNMNRGPWMRLEGTVREYVKRGNVVWVVTGPLYLEDMDPLPEADETHFVPSAYWKVIVSCEDWENRCSGETPLVAAFIMQQVVNQSDNWEGFSVPLKEVRQKAGLELHPKLTGVNDGTGTVHSWLNP